MICRQLKKKKKKTDFFFSTPITLNFLTLLLIGKTAQTLTEAKQYSHENIEKIPRNTVIEFQGCYSKPNETVKKSRSKHR